MLQKLRKLLLNSQSGAIHLIAILFLLLAGVAIGVGVLQQRTNFFPFAQQAEQSPKLEQQQGFYLTPQYLPTKMELNDRYATDEAITKSYPYIVGSQIKVAVTVATDPQPVWGFNANISYPKDSLEVVNINVTPLPDDIPLPPVPPTTCKDDTQCRSSEYCEHVACIAVEGVKCPEEGFCISKVGKLCSDNIPCGTGFKCDFSQRPTNSSFGQCVIERGTTQEGQSCKITNDCGKGLSCIQKQSGSSEGICQKERTSNLGEFLCQSDNDCSSGYTCQEIRGSSHCTAEGACTNDYTLQGKFCALSNQINESAGEVSVQNNSTGGHADKATQVCAQVITRACTYQNVTCVKAPCPPQKICKDFPTPCDVPPGWTKEGEEAGGTRNGVGEDGSCAKNNDCQKGLICGAPACARNGGTCTQGTVCQKPGNGGSPSAQVTCTSNSDCSGGLSCLPVLCTDLHDAETCNRIDWIGNYSICKKSSDNTCPQIETYACYMGGNKRTKECPQDSPNCGEAQRECKTFSSPCEVPAGWVIQKKEPPVPAKKIPDYFITNWTEQTYDNDQGLIKLHGTTKEPGIQTSTWGNRPVMALVTFKLKKAGSIVMKVNDDASMFSQDYGITNIDKGQLSFTVIEPGQSFNGYNAENEHSEQPGIIKKLTGIIRKLLMRE